MPVRALSELNFMDIYICLDGDMPAHYCHGITGEALEIDADVPVEYQDDVRNLTAAVNKDFVGVEKGLSYGGMRLRISKLMTSTGKTWAAIRRIPELPPKFDKIGFIPQLIPALRDCGKRGGLILLCGATGQGKTTTSCSMLLDFLENYGGVAFTIEDPVEYAIEGRRGKSGYCYQSEVKEEAEWGQMLKRSLRWHPRYIFVGEVRTPDAANQLLRASTSGHTVITTLHGGSMEEALEGLLQLAEQEIGDRAALLLAAGLTVVIHQTLTPRGLIANFMITEADNPGSPIRALIRDKRIGQSRSIADQQMALLMRDGRLFSKR